MADAQLTLDEASLLQAKSVKNAAWDWTSNSTDGSQITMRPFMNIVKESYSPYVRLKS